MPDANPTIGVISRRLGCLECVGTPAPDRHRERTSIIHTTRRSIRTTAVLLGLTVAVGGCALAPVDLPRVASDHHLPAKPGPTASPDAVEVDPERGAALTVLPFDAQWQTTTTSDKIFTLEHPIGWTVTAIAPAEPWPGMANMYLDITDEQGRTVASLVTGVGLGAGEPPRVTVLDEQPMDLPFDPATAPPGTVSPRFKFSVFEYPDGRVDAVMAVGSRPTSPTDPDPDFTFYLPLPGFGPDNQLAFTASPRNSREPYALNPLIPEFTSVGDAREFMKTTSYRELRRMFISLHIDGLE